MQPYQINLDKVKRLLIERCVRSNCETKLRPQNFCDVVNWRAVGDSSPCRRAVRCLATGVLYRPTLNVSLLNTLLQRFLRLFRYNKCLLIGYNIVWVKMKNGNLRSVIIIKRMKIRIQRYFRFSVAWLRFTLLVLYCCIMNRHIKAPTVSFKGLLLKF